MKVSLRRKLCLGISLNTPIITNFTTDSREGLSHAKAYALYRKVPQFDPLKIRYVHVLPPFSHRRMAWRGDCIDAGAGSRLVPRPAFRRFLLLQFSNFRDTITKYQCTSNKFENKSMITLPKCQKTTKKHRLNDHCGNTSTSTYIREFINNSRIIWNNCLAC